MTFQRTVNSQPAPGVEGGFASANPYASLLAGDSQLVAGAAGVIIGRMAFARNDTGVVTNGHPGVLSRLAFVSRYNVALITTWLASSTLVIQPGIDMTLHDAGDFWARFAAGAAIGQKVFASYADGSLSAAATGTSVAGADVTATTVSGSATITVTAVASGTIALGQPVSGTGIPANSIIGSFGTGTGGTGTYALKSGITGAAALATASASVNVLTVGALETRWVVQSTAAATELAKITTRGIN